MKLDFDRFKEGADILVKICGQVKSQDTVLVIVDKKTNELGKFVMKSITEITENASMMLSPEQKMHGEEPSADIAAAMKSADVIFGLTSFSLAHTLARVNATNNGARYLSLPDYSFMQLASPSLRADFEERSKITKRLKERLDIAEIIRITSKKGTDITIHTHARIANYCPGICDAPGMMGSPPNIETNIAPIEEESNGVLVVDGSIPHKELGMIKKSIKIVINNGKIAAIDTQVEQGRILQNLMDSYSDEKVKVLAEFGIGLNPNANLCGLMLEDEGCLGTVHFGFGSNHTIGGKNKVNFHLDFIIDAPTVFINGQKIIEDGTLLTENEEINRIRHIFKRNGNRLFLIDSHTGQEFTYGAIEELSLKFATVLSELNISKGDKIAVIAPNCLEFVILYFACMQIGCIPVPINNKLHFNEIKYILSNSEASILFIASSSADLVPLLSGYVKKIIPFTPYSENEKDGAGDLLKKISAAPKYLETSFQKISDTDIIAIVYTSGTTKAPKGVIITYEHIIKNGRRFARILHLNKESRFYNYLSLAYLGGFYNLTLIPFLSEGSIVLDNMFNPKIAVYFWEQIKKYNINTLWLVPSIISIILSLDRANLGIDYCQKGNIRTVLVGTAPLPDSLKKRFEEKYHLVMYENYGLSETFFITTNAPNFSKNMGTGRLMPGCEVLILDENGKNCSAGELGEIVVKSEYATSGYYKNDEETARSIKNRLFYTGDIGYFDGDNYLFIAGRKKDLIIRGGINISPQEIEDAISTFQGVKDSAVIGANDDLKGERIIAFVIIEDNIGNSGDIKDGLKKHCCANLANFKVPEEFIFVKEFPRSVTGKVQKNKIKELYMAGSF